MAVRAVRTTGWSALDRHMRSVDEWASGRQVSLDNLKVILIASIIAMHAILGYAGLIDAWSYTGVREVTLSAVLETVLLLLISPFGYLVIPLLFLLAGLLAPPSLERKGPRRFARDRLVRLGLPFAVYVLLVQPLVMYALERPLGAATGSYWYEFLGSERQIDTGPLWFVGVLLVFSLVYAGWAAVRRRAARRGAGQLTARRLAVVAAAVAPLSFLVRLVYPYGSESGVTDLNLWEWPACTALFAVGIVASGRDWLAGIPERLSRQCRTTTLLAVVAMAVLLATVGLLDKVDDAMGGWHWPAAAFAAIESILTVFGPVWLLSAAQRHLDRPLRWAGPAVSRSAYGAFMLQTPVLIGLAVALRPAPLPAEVKAVIVATVGIAVAFTLAWLLISRIPAVARVL